MFLIRPAGVFVAVVLASTSVGAASAQTDGTPLRFFEGRTESESMVKVIMKRPYRSTALGRGSIRNDGSLQLEQQVEEQGKAHKRRWSIRQVSPGRFTGTMSEATGPVTVEEVRGRYRFRFKVKGNLSVEQWLTPMAGGKWARSKVTIRKMGIVVARSEGTIRKVPSSSVAASAGR